MKHKISVHKLGCMNYLKAWNLQKYLAAEIKNNVKLKSEAMHKLLIVEHYPVFTIGIRSSNYALEEEKRLRSLGAEFHRTNRGGLITFHGPGQLTAYPLLHLSSLNRGIKWYVSALEKTVIGCCHLLGISAETTGDTGIWIEDRKICAIGIQGRHVTTHGLALNCNIDLSWFDHIVPCGIEGKSVTSISKELNKNVSVCEVLPHFLKSFEEIFDAELVEDKSLLKS